MLFSSKLHSFQLIVKENTKKSWFIDYLCLCISIVLIFYHLKIVKTAFDP